MIPEEYAKRHSSFLHGYGFEATQLLLHRLQLKGNERVLEIGCGTGGSLVLLKKNYPNIQLTGLDISSLMVEKARQRLKWCSISDVEVIALEKEKDFPFENQSFDLVLLESVLGILPKNELEDLLSKVDMILKKNGRLALNETIWRPDVSVETAKAFNQKCMDKYGIQQASTFLMHKADWLRYFEENGLRASYCQLTAEAMHEKMNTYPMPIASKLFDFFGKIRFSINTLFHKGTKRIEELSKTEYHGEHYLESYVFIFEKA